MGWGKMVLAFLALQSAAALLSMDGADAGDFLSPLFQPIFDGICNHTVECGKGTCEEASDSMFGFACKCDKGWSQFQMGDNLRFLPCVVPNCSFDFSCSNDSSTRAAAPSPSLTNISSWDACAVSYCGGGTCVKASTFGYRCECKEGYSNLLNVTSLPCYNDCSIGADCKELGISFTNSSSAPPSLPDSGGGNSTGKGYNFAPNRLLWMLPTLLLPVVM